MNYLQLINKCLLELNYKQVNSFSELIKNDHKRIMSILNVINKEVSPAHFEVAFSLIVIIFILRQGIVRSSLMT